MARSDFILGSDALHLTLRRDVPECTYVNTPNNHPAPCTPEFVRLVSVLRWNIGPAYSLEAGAEPPTGLRRKSNPPEPGTGAEATWEQQDRRQRQE
eukprot:1140850-Pelagomonas_calceolata.AAC.1